MLNTIRDILWGPFTILIIFFVGLFLTFKCKFIQFNSIPYIIIGEIFKKPTTQTTHSPFNAFCIALGGTLGVGNLAGVAVAITLGGSGSIFWMLFMSFFGMVIKYSEIFLCAVYRKFHNNIPFSSAMTYIRYGAKLPFLSKLYAVFALLTGLTMGSMVQSNAVSSAFSEFPPFSIGIILAFICSLIIFGGLNRIAKFSTAIVPLMAIFYIIFACATLFIQRDRILFAINDILRNAFQTSSVSSGFLGFITSTAISQGFSRGIFSNEAGLGTSTLAHGNYPGFNPSYEGMIGILEVFLDTFVFCFLTALVILTSDTFLYNQSLVGTAFTVSAFADTFGSFAIFFLRAIILLLSITSIIGWGYYSEICLKFLNAPTSIFNVYKQILVLMIFLGSILEVTSVYHLSDIINVFMVFINLTAIVVLSNKIK